MQFILTVFTLEFSRHEVKITKCREQIKIFLAAFITNIVLGTEVYAQYMCYFVVPIPCLPRFK